MEDENGPAHDIESLRSGCTEARQVLDYLNVSLDDIADRGVWTARTAIIVLGLVVSALSIGGLPDPDGVSPSVLVTGGFGALLLFSSIVGGLGIYLRTENVPGVGPGARDTLTGSRLPELEWRLALLGGYDSWIETMDEKTDRAGRWLYVTWGLLTTALLLLTLAAALSLHVEYPSP